MLRLLKTAFDKITDYSYYLACLLMFIGFVVVCGEVIVRSFFGLSLFWITEVTEYILVFSTYLGAAYILKKGEHATIDILTELFKPRLRAIVKCVTDSVAAICCGTVAWFGFKAVLFHIEHGTHLSNKVLNLPMGPMLAVLPLGFLFLTIQFIWLLSRQIRQMKKGEI